jgi:hypothetical protein
LQEFLDIYLVTGTPDGIHRLDYAAAGSFGRQMLSDYIENLEVFEIRKYNSTEQFAYWVNLYNAVTVRLILDNYPVSSIRKISDPWGRKLVRVEGEDISLNDIEHRILRPIWQDPRIHFVVNCASLGCPNLPASALTADRVEETLDAAAFRFIGHNRGAERGKDILVLSSIFDWYKEDFGANKDEVLRFIGKYRNFGPLDGVRVRYEYDWNLNDVSK